MEVCNTMDLVIMAAGMGSRFGGLKQMEPINEDNQFIIDYSIYDAVRAGVDRVVFIIKEENYHAFRETVGARVEKVVETEYVFQRLECLPHGFKVPKCRVKPWGTAHAILSCRQTVHGDFIVINADDFYGYDAFKTVADFLKNKKSEHEFAIVGYRVKNTLTNNGAVKRAVCVQSNGYLETLIESSIEEKNGKIYAEPLSGAEGFEVEPNAPVSMNMFGFTQDVFRYLETRFKTFLIEEMMDNPEKCEFLIPDVVSEMIGGELVTVKVLDTSSVWHGVTYKEDKEEVVSAIKALVDKGEYPQHLWEE